MLQRNTKSGPSAGPGSGLAPARRPGSRPGCRFWRPAPGRDCPARPDARPGRISWPPMAPARAPATTLPAPHGAAHKPLACGLCEFDIIRPRFQDFCAARPGSFDITGAAAQHDITGCRAPAEKRQFGSDFGPYPYGNASGAERADFERSASGAGCERSGPRADFERIS